VKKQNKDEEHRKTGLNSLANFDVAPWFNKEFDHNPEWK